MSHIVSVIVFTTNYNFKYGLSMKAESRWIISSYANYRINFVLNRGISGFLGPFNPFDLHKLPTAMIQIYGTTLRIK